MQPPACVCRWILLAEQRKQMSWALLCCIENLKAQNLCAQNSQMFYVHCTVLSYSWANKRKKELCILQLVLHHVCLTQQWLLPPARTSTVTQGYTHLRDSGKSGMCRSGTSGQQAAVLPRPWWSSNCGGVRWGCVSPPCLGGCKEGGKWCREATAASWELMWRSGGQERQGQGMLMCISAHRGAEWGAGCCTAGDRRKYSKRNRLPLREATGQQRKWCSGAGDAEVMTKVKSYWSETERMRVNCYQPVVRPWQLTAPTLHWLRGVGHHFWGSHALVTPRQQTPHPIPAPSSQEKARCCHSDAAAHSCAWLQQAGSAGPGCGSRRRQTFLLSYSSP